MCEVCNRAFDLHILQTSNTCFTFFTRPSCIFYNWKMSWNLRACENFREEIWTLNWKQKKLFCLLGLLAIPSKRGMFDRLDWSSLRYASLLKCCSWGLQPRREGDCHSSTSQAVRSSFMSHLYGRSQKSRLVAVSVPIVPDLRRIWATKLWGFEVAVHYC